MVTLYQVKSDKVYKNHMVYNISYISVYKADPLEEGSCFQGETYTTATDSTALTNKIPIRKCTMYNALLVD